MGRGISIKNVLRGFDTGGITPPYSTSFFQFKIKKTPGCAGVFLIWVCFISVEAL
jgi:hypothetical protein